MPIKSHLGVYAFIYQNDSLLLIKKARGPYQGMYDLPGGTIEPNELITETLEREIKEETGCYLVTCEQIGTVDTRFVWNRENENKPQTLFKHIGILYFATVTGKETSSGDGQDSDGAIWISISDICQKKVSVSPFVTKGLQIASELKK